MSPILTIIALFVAIFGSAFLFWRACRHELIESELAFDATIVALLGALVGARIFDFLANFGSGVSFAKLVFFNAYGGFDFWGALLGGAIAAFFFLRGKRIKILYIFDLLAAPVVFGQTVFNLLMFLISKGDPSFAYFSLGYLLIFIILKRLAAKKHHFGFFAGAFIVSISTFNLIMLLVGGENTYVGKIPYHLSIFVSYLIFGIIFWYLAAKRNTSRDVKNISADLLLSMFKLKRTITSTNEAGGISKAILFSPMFLVKNVLFIIKLVMHEIRLGLLDFLYVLGLRHDRY